jgi:hypothetical protein
MDATRPRRLRDCARQEWYARWRCFRLARHLGFPSTTAVAPTPEARLLLCSGCIPALPRLAAASGSPATTRMRSPPPVVVGSVAVWSRPPLRSRRRCR